ncbi:hypothetical protein CPB97_012180 [Podila verticillata]|nr:hypothetical protein CPB97_012180 [Podila verticillata]
MLASVCRASAIELLAPKSLISSSPSSYNLVSRRIKSDDDVDEEEARPHTDALMVIIAGSISSQGAGSPANEEFRMARGSFRKGDIYKSSDLNRLQAGNMQRAPQASG